ncbi:MAG TPA: hypothetical protein VGN00_24770 [Puia sp.]|jgi:uncharacterized membrane protein YhiD involved in acid resistance
MKNVILFFLVALFLLPACGSVAPLRSMEESVNIRVECNDNPGTRQMVLQMLRQAKARDVTETKEATCAEIKASYYLEDNSPDKLEDIADLLRMQTGVIFVEILENQNVVKQNR